MKQMTFHKSYSAMHDNNKPAHGRPDQKVKKMENPKKWTLGLVAVGILSLPIMALANDVDCFKSLVLDKNAPAQVLQPEKVEITEEKLTKDGKPVAVIKAANKQDAANAAVTNLRKHNGTVAVITTPSGIGVVVRGTAGYREAPNRNASLIIKRLASIRAFYNAKGSMAEYFHGLTVEAQDRLAAAIEQYDDNNLSLSNLDSIRQENIKNRVEGMIAGYVVYSVKDDPVKKSWEVVLVSTPKTRGETLRISQGVVVANDLAAGMEHVYAELSSGILPPAGGRVITVPGTGQVVFVGFGSEIKRINKNPAVERALAEAAKNVARMRAAKNLCAVIIGEKASWVTGMSNQTQDANRQFNETIADDPATKNNINTMVEPVEETLGKFKDIVAVRSEFKFATNGKIPPGTLTFSFENSDWVYHSYVFSTEMSALADKGRKGMLEKSIKERSETMKRSIRFLKNGQSTGQTGGGSRNIDPSNDRDTFGNDRPIGQAPSGKVSPKKDL